MLPAIVSIVATLVFAVLLLALHRLKPEIDPRWRMISEYAIGRWGGLMQAAFTAWWIGELALAIALRPHVPPAGALLLGLASFGPLGAAIFTTDPITTPHEQTSPAGRLHAGFGALFIIGFPIATAVLALGGATSPAVLRAWLIGMAILVWLGFAGFVASLGRHGRAGRPSPQMPIGRPNRLMVAAYVLWTIVIAAAVLSSAG